MAKVFVGADLLLIARVLEDSTGAFVTQTPRVLAPVGAVGLPDPAQTKTVVKDGQAVAAYRVGHEQSISLRIAALSADLKNYIVHGETEETGFFLDDGREDQYYFALAFRTKMSDGSFHYYWFQKGTLQIEPVSVETQNGTQNTPQTLTYKPIFTTHLFAYANNRPSRSIMVDSSLFEITPARWSAVVWTPENFNAVPMPLIMPNAGTYETPVTLMLEPVEPTDIVRYTLDGTDPTIESPVFAQGITIERSTTVKAIECAMCGTVSPVVVTTYQITEQTTAFLEMTRGVYLNITADTFAEIPL